MELLLQSAWNQVQLARNAPHPDLSTKSDVPERLLKLIVGHSSSMDTFGIYGHDVDGELERGAKILDRIFEGLLGREVLKDSLKHCSDVNLDKCARKG